MTPNMSVFDSMTESQLKEYIAFLLHHYRVVDAFWFIKVTEHFDQATAEEINEEVWEKAAGMASKDLIRRFGINEKGLDGFVRAKRLFPWCSIIDYHIEQHEHEVFITVPVCPVQDARLKRGLGEYKCREMHHRDAGVVDPRIRGECLFAPPGEHPAGCHCRWRFYLADAQDPGEGGTGQETSVSHC